MSEKIKSCLPVSKKCNRLIKIMKISVLLFFFCLFSMTAKNVYSQQAELSLDMKNVTIEEVISEIEKKSDYVFLITNEAQVELAKRTSLHVDKESIQEILEIVLKDTGLGYTVVERQVSVYKNSLSKETGKIDNKKKEITDQTALVNITGKVTDAFSDDPIPGVNVVKSGTSIGTVTDIDGVYELSVNEGDTLVFSFIGYQTQKIEVGKVRVINVRLSEYSEMLEEAVVVAFGKQSKESVISSISTVSTKDLKVPSSNLTTAFAGRVAGLISYQTSGEPGMDNAQFFIRGITTFGADAKKDPLILIDGVELTTDDLARLNTDDIATFSIMKDATATALYGARGANGVILVTTKEGREGKVQVNARVENSFSSPTQNVQLADPDRKSVV